MVPQRSRFSKCARLNVPNVIVRSAPGARPLDASTARRMNAPRVRMAPTDHRANRTRSRRRRARRARPEQAVDHERFAVVDGVARHSGLSQRALGAGVIGFGGHGFDDAYADPNVSEGASDDPRIAAVVSGTGEDDHSARETIALAQRQLARCGGAGALHQRARRNAHEQWRPTSRAADSLLVTTRTLFPGGADRAAVAQLAVVDAELNPQSGFEHAHAL